MSRAVAEVPFDDKEAELLSGGVPRGFKALTTATSKLVKAGWLVKGRSGWTATEEGVRAVRAFPDADRFATAMLTGEPVPEQPLEVEHAPQSPEQLSEEAQFTPTEDPTPPDAAVDLDVTAAEDSAGDEAWLDQPQSVALSGDFDPILGEAGHWSTDTRELQLSYEADENLWRQTLQLPAGTYQYKILVNGSWDENYGRFGVRNGANHELHLLSDSAVTFRFDYSTKDITTS
ncbi:glycosidase [Arthrobacter echini]|nr:glycosidase [Arthrobacter echini]